MKPHPAAGKGSIQTLRRSVTLLADALESKSRKALVHHHYDEATAPVHQGSCVPTDGSRMHCETAKRIALQEVR